MHLRHPAPREAWAAPPGRNDSKACHMSLEKENFLRSRLVTYLQKLNPSLRPLWGKMSVQQMIEHYTEDALRVASGRAVYTDVVTPPGTLQKYRDFLMSEKPFRPNTSNPLLREEPAPPRFSTVQASIGNLHEELIGFFEVFEKNPQLVTRNPIFGDLNFEQNVQLLYKHAIHHLRQFGADTQLG